MVPYKKALPCCVSWAQKLLWLDSGWEVDRLTNLHTPSLHFPLPWHGTHKFYNPHMSLHKWSFECSKYIIACRIEYILKHITDSYDTFVYILVFLFSWPDHPSDLTAINICNCFSDHGSISAISYVPTMEVLVLWLHVTEKWIPRSIFCSLSTFPCIHIQITWLYIDGNMIIYFIFCYCFDLKIISGGP